MSVVWNESKEHGKGCNRLNSNYIFTWDITWYKYTQQHVKLYQIITRSFKYYFIKNDVIHDVHQRMLADCIASGVAMIRVVVPFSQLSVVFLSCNNSDVSTAYRILRFPPLMHIVRKLIVYLSFLNKFK